VNRGEVYDIDWPGLGTRPAVVVTRPSAMPHLANVTVVLVTTRVRGLPTEVELDVAHGLIEGSVANCDNVLTIPKTALLRHRGTLGPAELRALDDALRIALALD
jgi:mRNA interferase MazF